MSKRVIIPLSAGLGAYVIGGTYIVVGLLVLAGLFAIADEIKARK